MDSCCVCAGVDAQARRDTTHAPPEFMKSDSSRVPRHENLQNTSVVFLRNNENNIVLLSQQLSTCWFTEREMLTVTDGCGFVCRVMRVFLRITAVEGGVHFTVTWAGYC